MRGNLPELKKASDEFFNESVELFVRGGPAEDLAYRRREVEKRLINRHKVYRSGLFRLSNEYLEFLSGEIFRLETLHRIGQKTY